ncbi:hypothetical protein NIE88_10395 [Sporolactobacillus shoreicorticis]|uniref:Uncharacterized protein n=1 Tax=Sporolactobacillus shoreicorticis TaxID=1923877 RepID=A0ABW5S9W1_9BACL|nr:hypothetical protein [Sporolactobacillus shoreicorticis]MCO7126184.1 hypothetical protein [Sporolactobacillus shoreicorticis]
MPKQIILDDETLKQMTKLGGDYLSHYIGLFDADELYHYAIKKGWTENQLARACQLIASNHNFKEDPYIRIH